MEGTCTLVNSLAVHVYNVLTLLREFSNNLFFHVADCFFCRENVCKLEECWLKNCRSAFSETDFCCDINSVYSVNFDVVVSDVFLWFSRQVLVQFFIRPLAVDEECTAVLNILNHLVALDDVRLVVTCNKVSLVDVVWWADRFVTKAEVRNCDTACFFRVILEVCLNVFVCVVTDNFCRVFVCTYSTVTADTPEFTFNCTFSRCDWSRFNFRKREVCNIINNSQSKAWFRIFFSKFCVNSKYWAWRCVFWTKTIAAAWKNNIVKTCFAESCCNIQEERFTQRARFLCAVENCNLFSCFRKFFKEFCRYPRSVEVNLDKSDFFALLCKVVDNFFCNITDWTHCNDYAVCIFCTVVVEKAVVCAQLFVDFFDVFFNDCRKCIICWVTCFAVLEEYVTVFVWTAHSRMFRI